MTTTRRNTYSPARDLLVSTLIRNGGKMARIDAADAVGPHGARGYGYETIARAVKAGIVRLTAPLPGRRGATVELVTA